MPLIPEIYDRLWNEAVSAFERGEPKLDPHLPEKTNDLRRGVTLVCRPCAGVRDRVAGFIKRLSAFCPGQYFYRPEELHVTVLCVITGTPLWREQMPRAEASIPLIEEALRRQPSFQIKFRGLTAAPDSVMIQGFPVGEGLTNIREAVREAFSRAEFGDMLDRRYKVTAAHITIMRFCKPDADLQPLLAFLKENRETNFGECEFKNIQLIFGDWYASANTVRTLKVYPLIEPRP